MNPFETILAKVSRSNPIRREITVEAKVLNEKEGLVRYVASDETLDCYNEIVRASGWRFTQFAKNAPFVDSHDYSSVTKLLGQVVAFEVKGGQLIEDVKYALTTAGNTLADWTFAMVRDKFLRAVSVGFVPSNWASKWDSDKSKLLAQIAELKLDSQTAAKLSAVYIEQEQIELSQCVIGANPNALAKSYAMVARAHKAGCLSEENIHQFSSLIANVNSVRSSPHRADDDRTRRRTRAAVLLEIENQLSQIS
jgi:hypothetical protein